MALDPIVSGTLNQMLEGNSFVEQRDPFKTNIWGEVDTGMMGEIPMWRNPRTGKREPVDGYPGPVHGGGFKPIGTYDPNKPSFPVQLPYPARQSEVAGIFSPLNPFNWGSKVPEIREQVQQGTYEPEGEVVSPLDGALRGISGRNRDLQKVMDKAGW